MVESKANEPDVFHEDDKKIHLSANVKYSVLVRPHIYEDFLKLKPIAPY